jgi:hypothetical protein
MDACFGLLHFLLFEKQLDDVMLLLPFITSLPIFRFILLLQFLRLRIHRADFAIGIERVVSVYQGPRIVPCS